MFQLNPLDLTNAWWQHLLMLVVPGIIGYILGYRKSAGTTSNLEEQLAQVGEEIEKCRQGKALLTPRQPTPPAYDDLKVVEGIGPAIEKLLNEGGIRTYAELSKTSPESIKKLLDNGGPRFQVHDAKTWPKQAELAASGKWAELKEWQNRLEGGRA